jgi:glycosyltransferase involved in cell wall biosynthesis
MEILYLSDYYNSKTGQPLNTIAEIMETRGHSIKVYTSSKDADPSGYDDSSSSLKIKRFRTVKLFGKCLFPGLMRMAFQKNPDITHSYVFGFFSTTMASYLKKLKGNRLIITSDLNLEEPEAGLIKKFYIKMFRKIPSSHADMIITYTDQQRKNLIEMGIPPSKIKKLPIGIDWKRFSSNGGKLKGKLMGRNFMLLNVSNISPVKNLEMIIKSLSPHKNVSFVHIGGDIDKEYKKKLDKLIRELKLEKRVKFLGPIPNQKIPEYYAAADAYIQTSHRESYCIPILEAMASGLPVITTRVGITKELGDIGFFVRNGKEVAKSIKLLQNKRKARYIGINNREIAKKYDWNNIIIKLEKIYKDLIRKGSGK